MVISSREQSAEVGKTKNKKINILQISKRHYSSVADNGYKGTSESIDNELSEIVLNYVLGKTNYTRERKISKENEGGIDRRGLFLVSDRGEFCS